MALAVPVPIWHPLDVAVVVLLYHLHLVVHFVYQKQLRVVAISDEQNACIARESNIVKMEKGFCILYLLQLSACNIISPIAYTQFFIVQQVVTATHNFRHAMVAHIVCSTIQCARKLDAITSTCAHLCHKT